MKILFLSLGKVWDIYAKGLYSDLLREFIRDGHDVFVVTPVERRYKEKTTLINQKNAKILKVRTLNIQKTSFLEKGLGTVLLECQYLRAIRKYYKGVSFDLILYTTPPITLVKPIRYIKKRDAAKTYLMLKDIFPQNAVDLGMMQTKGIKGLFYKFFRKKEKQLYTISDKIGCMSQANVDYVLKHNPEILPEKVEICPNSIEYVDLSLSEEEKIEMRQKYDLPLDKKIFVYGGNLGKPQGIPFLIECLRAEKENDNAYFLIAGDGTEYGKLEAFINLEKPTNTRLMRRLPKEDYDRLVAACDVGLIFLDHRFTIPNFPSRLLSYMQAGIPVIACTDSYTDVGKTITDGAFGWWCESVNTAGFKQTVDTACMFGGSVQQIEKEYLNQYYSSRKSVDIICNGINLSKS